MLGVSYPQGSGITHKTINAFDLPSYRMTPHFDEATRFIEVLVYLMRREGMGFKQAHDYVRSKRGIICPNEGFVKELKREELAIKKRSEGQAGKEEKAVLEFVSQDGQKQKEAREGKEEKGKEDKANEDKGKEEKEKEAKEMILGRAKEQPLRQQPKMNATMGSGQVMFGSIPKPTKEGTGLPRGTSLNYSRKPQEAPKDKNPVSKLTQQFLTFKLETPKIVTICK